MSESRFPWEVGMHVLKLFDAGDVLLEGDGDCFPGGYGCLEEPQPAVAVGCDPRCPQEGFPLRPGCILCQEMSFSLWESSEWF